MQPTATHAPFMQLCCEGHWLPFAHVAPSHTPKTPHFWPDGHAAASPQLIDGTAGSPHWGGVSFPVKHLL
jgi:hypothetical protein